MPAQARIRKDQIANDCAAFGVLHSPYRYAGDARYGGAIVSARTLISAESRRLDECFRVIVKASREDADVEQKELARRLGVTRNVIANLENGRRVMTVADFVMIARALNINAETLLRRVLQWG